MDEKPNYYAVIPSEVRYDKRLKDKSKILFGEISALSNKEGVCWASNSYFAELYQVSVQTISSLFKELEETGYIKREYKLREGTKEIESRYTKILVGGYTKNFVEGIQENFKENNTSINNTSINNKEIYKESSHKYGQYQNVLLTDTQLETLKSEFPKDYLNRIENVSSYCASTGKSYKNYLATIRNWARKETPKPQRNELPKYEMDLDNL